MKISRSQRRLWAALLTVLILGGMLAACGDGLVSLSYEDGKFVNNAKKLSYVPAPVSYEPTYVGEPYAYYKKGDITMYAIGKSDPKLWLTESYAGAATTVFYSDTITLPTLADFGADTIHVCISENLVFEVCTIDDAATIGAVVDCFLNGEKADWPVTGAEVTYDMKFSSADWPEIYINLIYGVFPEGNFLYDRGTKRCVETGDLLDAYLGALTE